MLPVRSALPRLRQGSCRALTLAAALAILPSCAARSVVSSPPADAEEAPLPDDVEGTLAALDRAEGDLFGAIGAPGGGAQARAREPAPLGKPERQAYAGAEPVAPATAPPPPPAETAVGQSTEVGGDVAQRPCDRACRALSSMQRAAEHLCGLTGDADARCASARDRVQRAGERVRDTCPACAHP